MTDNSHTLADSRSAAHLGSGETRNRQAVPFAIPFAQRPTCTIKEACNAAGLGRTKLYELIGGGALETTTIGRRRLVRIPSLLKLLNRQ